MKNTGFIQYFIIGFIFLLFFISAENIYAQTEYKEGECKYPGHMGGPFEGLPECVPGRHTEPLTCCNSPVFPDDNRYTINCEDPENCFEIKADYKACGAPMSSFVVDDDDNVYFWSGRWNLHALDKNGNLKWRYDFCEPYEDESVLGCKSSGSCEPGKERYVNIPTIVDFHNNLFFFIGDILYSLDQNGNLILKKKIELPGIKNPEKESLFFATGARGASNIWGTSSDNPILLKNGNIIVGFTSGTKGKEWADYNKYIKNNFYSGWAEIKRTGEVVNVYNFFHEIENSIILYLNRIILLENEKLFLTGSKIKSKPLNYDIPSPGSVFLFEDKEIKWQEELKIDFEIYQGGKFEEDWFRPALALGQNGMVFGLTRHGAVYAIDTINHEMKRIFNFQMAEVFSWQNRPVVDENGILYFEMDPFGKGTLWALDTNYLWEHPYSEIDVTKRTPLNEIPGVKWVGEMAGSCTMCSGYSTPLLTKNKRLYTGLSGLSAFDMETGKEAWWLGGGTSATAPVMLSDGTIVMGFSGSGWVYFVKDSFDHGGMLETAWPRAYHDKYNSNNINHPFKWDRTKEEPYKSVSEMLTEIDDPCFNEATSDKSKCELNGKKAKNSGCSCVSVSCNSTKSTENCSLLQFNSFFLSLILVLLLFLLLKTNSIKQK